MTLASRVALAAVATASLATMLTGCKASVHIGADSIGASTVAKKATSALAAKVGITPKVTCPHDLSAKTGASMRCVLVDPTDDSKHTLLVTVKSAHDGHYNLGFDVTK